MSMRKELGIPLLKMSIAYNRLLELMDEHPDWEDSLAASVSQLAGVIQEIDECRKASEQKVQPLNGNSGKPYLNS